MLSLNWSLANVSCAQQRPNLSFLCAFSVLCLAVVNLYYRLFKTEYTKSIEDAEISTDQNTTSDSILLSQTSALI